MKISIDIPDAVAPGLLRLLDEMVQSGRSHPLFRMDGDYATVLALLERFAAALRAKMSSVQSK